MKDLINNHPDYEIKSIPANHSPVLLFYKYKAVRKLRGCVMVQSQLRYYNVWEGTEGEKGKRKQVTAEEIG